MFSRAPVLVENYAPSSGPQDWMSAPHSTGTSIMAAEFDGGVVIGADSRTTTGAYIANRVTDKLTKVTDNIYCCRSGSAADTQAIADIVSYHLNFHANGGQVYSVRLVECVRQPVSIGGSGSSYVYGYVDANFKQGMAKEECVNFITNTLSLAMARDGSSGGVVRLGIITEEGIERRVILGNELPKFYEG
ncbi:proteasome subunit alpha/beta [Holotrichia oblita]|uniref:Proteasome subunit alpha/beta n=1 Tax=Holotrichia oblita TaxID=644536 RepID=A0ACB9TY78_HOLOL|nr:proteasome subunit alpha/beta [Holotrichia oblita]